MITNLNIFATQMNQLAGNIQQNERKLLRDVATAIVDKVAETTPIDTGQASSNWITSLGAPVQHYNPVPKTAPIGGAGPGVSKAQVRQAVAPVKGGQSVWIANNVPYIVELNRGSSKQAPRDYVDKAVVTALSVAGKFQLLIK